MSRRTQEVLAEIFGVGPEPEPIVEDVREVNFDGGVREPAPESISPEDAHTRTLLEIFGVLKSEMGKVGGTGS